MGDLTTTGTTLTTSVTTDTTDTTLTTTDTTLTTTDTTLTTTVTTLTAAGALKALHAAHARSLEIGVPVNISVCDAAGHELAFLRPDGAALISMGIARDKAYTVAAFLGIPTADWYGMIADEPALLNGIVHRDRLVIFAGGVPIRVDGTLVGAIGCSGGSAEQDADVAQAGADAVT